MTEDQAKTKWCPFARGAMYDVSGEDAPMMVSANRASDGLPMDKCMCIASACMLWDASNGACGLKIRG